MGSRLIRHWKLAALIVGVIVGPLVVLGALAAIALANFHLFEIPQRKHLHAIPIDTQACKYVVTMHHAANDFQLAYPILGAAFDANGQQRSSSDVRTRLARAGDELDYSITAAVPHFPPQVQWYLTVARNDVRAGRAQLTVATDGVDFFNRTQTLLSDGQLAFGYAGDLIGHQCPVPLGADNSTFLYPFETTATPAPTAQDHEVTKTPLLRRES